MATFTASVKCAAVSAATKVGVVRKFIAAVCFAVRQRQYWG